MINLRGRDVESFVLEAQEKIKSQLKLPDGYTSLSSAANLRTLIEAKKQAWELSSRWRCSLIFVR
jgi:cobalt-zinc-cadmium resistance protein CzcA